MQQTAIKTKTKNAATTTTTTTKKLRIEREFDEAVEKHKAAGLNKVADF